MSKKRKVARYLVAGAVTGLYGAAIFKAYTEPELPKSSPERVAIAASVLAGLTWLAAAL